MHETPRENRPSPRAALVLAAILGCGEAGPTLVPARGRVLYNDEPLAGAEVVLHPRTEGPGWMPVGVTGEDGSFAVGTRGPGDGAPPGRYGATVAWRPPGEDEDGPSRLPARYARPESSGLEFDVGPGAGELPEIRLSGPPIRGRRP